MPSANGSAKLAAMLDATPKTSGYESIRNYGYFRQPRDLPLFTFDTIRAMDLEPTILIGESARRAPLMGIEFAFKRGDQWVTGIEAEDDRIATFVQRQLLRIWSHGVTHLLTNQTWGWAGAEVMLRLTPWRTVEVDRLIPRHAMDVKALERRGDLCGVRFERIKAGETRNGVVDLGFPKCIFAPFFPEPGTLYGQSIRHGAYSPWADKWLSGGALDVRRLFMHKDAYGGADLAYPDGYMEIEGKGSVPNRDVAREIVEQMQSGSVTTRPSDIDPVTGKQRWELTRASAPASPTHILQYPDDLDIEMLRGMIVPDGLLIEGDTGAWKGRAIPLSVFYSCLDMWAAQILESIDFCCIRHLVEMNFGKGRLYNIQHKPFAEQEADRQAALGASGPGGGESPTGPIPQGNGNVPQDNSQRMSLDPVDAVGRGVLSAAELVKAARMALQGQLTFDEEKHPRDDDGKFAEKKAGKGGAKPSAKPRKSVAVKVLRSTEKAHLIQDEQGREGWIQKRWLGDGNTVKQETFDKAVESNKQRAENRGQEREAAKKEHEFRAATHRVRVAKETEKAVAVKVVIEMAGIEQEKLVWFPKSAIDGGGGVAEIPGWMIRDREEKAIDDYTGGSYYERHRYAKGERPRLSQGVAILGDDEIPESAPEAESVTPQQAEPQQPEVAAPEPEPKELKEPTPEAATFIADLIEQVASGKTTPSKARKAIKDSPHYEYRENLMRALGGSVSMSTDAEGNEHKGKGPGGGQFVAKGKGGSAATTQAAKPKVSKKEKQKAADAHFEKLMTTKSKADAAAFRAARKDGIAIPPAWTEVTYHGKDKNVLAEGRDDKGRRQRAENPAYRAGVSAQNNARITKTLLPRMEKVRQQLRKAAASGDPEAEVLYLIALTGFRIGGKGDGKAKTQAFGASTLTGDHVSVKGDTVTFDFPGKKGVRQQHSVTDPVIAKIAKRAKPGQRLFATNDAKVRGEWQEKYGGTKVHDIRHVVAYETAARELKRLHVPPPPEGKAAKQKLVKQVAAVAAGVLGNNPSQTLGTYIDPQLWTKAGIA